MMLHYFKYLTCSLLLITVACTSEKKQTETTNTNARSIRFNEYSNLKLGFTTQNFLQVMPVSVKNSKSLIDYAKETGFTWLELRDPDAILSLEECQEIAAYAKNENIEVSYAIQKGILDTDFWQTFNKGVKNAAVFQGPGVFRSLASGTEISGNAEQLGWTKEELEQLVQFADSAAQIARENGLQYVIENGGEAFFGENPEYFGVTDAFARVGDLVGWQFDTANPFSVSKVHATPADVEAFLQENADNLFYIHLKAAKDGQAQTVLMDNPLPFQKVFQVMSSNDVPYVAIELQATDTKEKEFQAMKESLEYLQTQNLITLP